MIPTVNSPTKGGTIDARPHRMTTWMVDLRVAIGMELLATDQADGVHRTPLGGEQKRCSQTLWPELGVEIYLFIYI